MRLAVGEVVARAVRRHIAVGSSAAVALVLSESPSRFEVEVTDQCDPSLPDDDEGVALTLVSALVPQLSVGGARIVLGWGIPDR